MSKAKAPAAMIPARTPHETRGCVEEEPTDWPEVSEVDASGALVVIVSEVVGKMDDEESVSEPVCRMAKL